MAGKAARRTQRRALSMVDMETLADEAISPLTAMKAPSAAMARRNISSAASAIAGPVCCQPASERRLQVSSRASRSEEEERGRGRFLDSASGSVVVRHGDSALSGDGILPFPGSDQVHGDVLGGGHVLRCIACSEAGKVVMEDDVEDPMEAVLDAPMGANGACESLGIQPCGGEIVSLLLADLSVPFGGGLDHGDGREGWKPPFIGIAPV